MQAKQPDGLVRRCTFLLFFFDDPGRLFHQQPLLVALISSNFISTNALQGQRPVFGVDASRRESYLPMTQIKDVFEFALGDGLQGAAADCNSAEETHAWFDSRVAHHSVSKEL